MKMGEYSKHNSVQPIKYLSGGWSAGVHSSVRYASGFLYICWNEFEFLVFSATFSDISAISWRPVLVVEEAGVPWENHRPWASNW
jgi:hypothetical protein